MKSIMSSGKSPEKKGLDFIDKMLLLMLVIGAFAVVHPYIFGGSIKTVEFVGDSMKDTIPEGSVIAVLMFNSPKELNAGEIGCYDDLALAAHFNRTNYIQCHHVHSVNDDAVIFHTDKYCILHEDGTQACNIIENEIPKSQVVGKVIAVMPSISGIGIAIAMIISILYFFDKYVFRKPPMDKLDQLVQAT